MAFSPGKMKYVSDTASIFTRYDIHLEVARQAARRISDDGLLQRVADSLMAGDDRQMVEVIGQALIHKAPLEVIDQGLL
jgi:methanol corrinoid protein